MNIKHLIEVENHFCSRFTKTKITAFGKLFYNLSNPTSHDSNHAIVEKIQMSPNEHIKDIIEFYLSKDIIPRIYHNFDNEIFLTLKPYLESNGFHIEFHHSKFYYLRLHKPIQLALLEIKRITELDSGLIDMIKRVDHGDYSIGVLKAHLKHPNFHLLGGYINHRCVTMASVNMFNGYSRIDDVKTDVNEQGKRYGQTLISYLIDYHTHLSKNILYLYSDSVIAQHIYQKLGFLEIKWNRLIWTATYIKYSISGGII